MTMLLLILFLDPIPLDAQNILPWFFTYIDNIFHIQIGAGWSTVVVPRTSAAQVACYGMSYSVPMSNKAK